MTKPIFVKKQVARITLVTPNDLNNDNNNG